LEIAIAERTIVELAAAAVFVLFVMRLMGVWK